MSSFGSFNRPVAPSLEGNLFTVDTKVTFLLQGEKQNGIIVKQLVNSAVVEMDRTDDNASFFHKNNGVIVVNYKKLQVV